MCSSEIPTAPADGVVKFHCEWASGAPPEPSPQLASALAVRARLVDRGWIGADASGIGFGNVSFRAPGGFWITGTGTGGLAELDAQGFSLVEEVSLESNWLRCRGPVSASSESMTHAALYAARPDVGAVLHIHSSTLWQRALRELPTTPASLPYGTPALACAVAELAAAGTQLLALGGHTDGLVAAAPTLEEAAQLLESWAALR